MKGDFSLQDATVGILGLGLMGGSLALALKGQCRAVVGSDIDPRAIQEVCQQEIVDAADRDPRRVLSGADVIILAAPVTAILELLDTLSETMPHPCIVMDIGSTKCSILRKMNKLPQRFEPVGGHPLCGKERLSLANAEASLYKNAPFFLTPLVRTTRRAMSAAYQIIEAVGAKPVIIEAAEHDRGLAMTSHLPFLLSSALSLAVPPELSKFVGPGFRSTSRLAGTSASMMLGVLQSNRENVLDALHSLQSELSRMEQTLAAEQDDVLVEVLNESRSKYHALVQ